MKVVVLGANGFLGANLVSELISKKIHVIGFGLKDEKNQVLRDRGVEMIEGNFLDITTLKIPFKDVDWLVHFASTTSPKESMLEPKKDSMNLTASKIIFEEAIKHGVKRILFSSSGGTVYGDKPRIPAKETDPVHPIIAYTKTKLAIEEELMSLCGKTKTVPIILRYANPYGINQYPTKGTGVVTAWLEAVRDNKPIVVYGDGEAARDYVYISDATRAAMLALESPTAKGIYNIGTGVPTSLNALLDTMKKVTKVEPMVTRVMQRPSDTVKTITLDSSKARSEFGWQPEVSLEHGITRTWHWVRNGEPFVT